MDKIQDSELRDRFWLFQEHVLSDIANLQVEVLALRAAIIRAGITEDQIQELRGESATSLPSLLNTLRRRHGLPPVNVSGL